MAYTRVNYRNVDATADAIHFLREPLGTEQLGVTVVECDPGWAGTEHDHADEDHEGVYLLLEGEATITIDSREAVPMEPGDAVRIAPDTTRRSRTATSRVRSCWPGRRSERPRSD